MKRRNQVLFTSATVLGSFTGGFYADRYYQHHKAESKAPAAISHKLPGVEVSPLPTIAPANPAVQAPVETTTILLPQTATSSKLYPGLECKGPYLDTVINDLNGPKGKIEGKTSDPSGDIVGMGHSILAAMTRASGDAFYRSIPAATVYPFITVVISESNAVFPTNIPTTNLDDAPVGNSYRFATNCVLK